MPLRDKPQIFRTPDWVATLAVSLCYAPAGLGLGGAELERYLLPVLPIFYIAVSLGYEFATTLGRDCGHNGLDCRIASICSGIRRIRFLSKTTRPWSTFVRLQQSRG